MELAKRIVLDIVSASQNIISAATEYASRRRFKNVQSCHFRLENEMQKISVAAEGVLNILVKSSPNGPPLDDRLRDWLSSDELPICLDTLHQMEKMLRLGDVSWMNAIFNFVNMVRSFPEENKINAVVKLFDSRRDHFHFLLTIDVWNCEDAQPQPQPRSLKQTLGPNIDAMEVDQSALLGTASTITVAAEKEKKQVDARKLDEVLKWLDGLSCAGKQEETLSLRQPDTCTWLHHTPQYEAWRNNDNSTLWLQGKPGSGKTVLASFIIDSLEIKRRGEALVFFYCDFRNERSTNAAEVMRSLLWQLLCHILQENINPGEVVGNLVKEKDSNTPILENVKRLASFVSQTAKLLSHQPSIVVDALDECRDSNKLIDALLLLAKGGMRLFVTSRPLQTIKDGLCGFQSLLIDTTSAVSTDIALHVTRVLDSSPRLRVLDSTFKTEIHTILCGKAEGMFRWVQCQIDALEQCATKVEVRRALDTLPIGLDETYRRILVAINTESPDGKLALRALVWLVGALRPLRLAEILEGLTIDLKRKIMDPETGAMHQGVLLHACGSLVAYNEKTDILILSHFSVKEYLTRGLRRTKLSRYHINSQRAHEHLARICICYITLYLNASDENTSQPRIVQTGGPRTISGELTHCSEGSPVVSSMSQRLLDYVLTHGFNHLTYLGLANRIVLRDMVALQSDIESRSAAWDKIRRMPQCNKLLPWPGPEHDFMLYVLIAFTSDSLLGAFLGHTHKVLNPKHRTNPLVYAAYFEKPQHAQLLLLHGAKVNEKGLVVNGSLRALPLEIAVNRVDHIMVHILLSAGSKVPTDLFAVSKRYFQFPVHVVRRLLETDQFMEWAADPRNVLPSPLKILEQQPSLADDEDDMLFVIQRLVQVGVDLTEHDTAQRTALYFAIRGGYQILVGYLLRIGTPLPRYCMDAISEASPSQRIPMLRVLVEAGVDVHTYRQFISGDTLLHLAIMHLREDCLEAVRLLMSTGCGLLTRNSSGKTPLHFALDKGMLSVVDNLLLRGVLDECHGLDELFVDNPVSRSRYGDALVSLDCTFALIADLLSSGKQIAAEVLFSILRSALPMTWIARTVRILVAKGADVHELSSDGNTLLHVTVSTLDDGLGLDVVRSIVGAGCDTFRRTVDGKTPLHIALQRNLPLVADYLLHSTGRPLSPDALFVVLRSPLPMAWRARMVRSLVANGADIHWLDTDENTLLHVAVSMLDDHHGLDVARFIVGTGGDPFLHTADGKTPLHIALQRNLPLVADYLLASTGKPLPRDALFSVLRSPLPMAWRARTVCSLIANGAEIHELSANRNTLLHVAVSTLNDCHGLDVVKLLVSTGLDPFWRNANDEVPIHIAAKHGSVSIIKYIESLNRQLPDDILFFVVASRTPSRVPMLRMLIEKGANTRAISVARDNLLHTAISTSSLSFRGRSDTQAVAKILIEHGCDAFQLNALGKSPLHIAVAKRNVGVVKYLLSITTLPLPADILACALGKGNAKTDPKNSLTILRLLIEKGADVAEGGPLLHVALSEQYRIDRLKIIDTPPLLNDHGSIMASNNLLDVIKFLVDSGCDPSQCDANGNPTIYPAIIGGHVQVVEYLLRRTATLPRTLQLERAIDLAPRRVRDKLRLVLGCDQKSAPQRRAPSPPMLEWPSREIENWALVPKELRKAMEI